MNLERSIINFKKKLNKVDPIVGSNNKTGLSIWKGKQILPLDNWIELRNTSYALEYFPDDFDQTLTYMPENELVTQIEQEDLRKWYSDYQGLMEYTKNPNYGRLKCFHCLLSPDGDDPIFVGINRLVTKGLNNDLRERYKIEYPCQVVNRFQCPYERTNIGGDGVEVSNSDINVDDLFRLHKMAFFVEIALAKARKSDSAIQIKDKQELLHVLTERDTLIRVLQHSNNMLKNTEYFREITTSQNSNCIVEYFMRIKDSVNL